MELDELGKKTYSDITEMTNKLVYFLFSIATVSIGFLVNKLDSDKLLPISKIVFAVVMIYLAFSIFYGWRFIVKSRSALIAVRNFSIVKRYVDDTIAMDVKDLINAVTNNNYPVKTIHEQIRFNVNNEINKKGIDVRHLEKREILFHLVPLIYGFFGYEDEISFIAKINKVEENISFYFSAQSFFLLSGYFIFGAYYIYLLI